MASTKSAWLVSAWIVARPNRDRLSSMSEFVCSSKSALIAALSGLYSGQLNSRWSAESRVFGQKSQLLLGALPTRANMVFVVALPMRSLMMHVRCLLFRPRKGRGYPHRVWVSLRTVSVHVWS